MRPAGSACRRRPRSTAAVSVMVMALGTVTLAPGVGAAAPAPAPALALDPASGGPGTPVVVTGTGFCGDPACGPARLVLAGQPVGEPLTVQRDGRLTTRFQAPGGRVAGDLQVVVEQTAADGSLLTASRPFGYSPSRGEAAERVAEERDAIARILDPSLPEPSPRGQPLASLTTGAAAPPASTGGGAEPTQAGDAEAAGGPASDVGGPGPGGSRLTVGLLAALAAVGAATWWWSARTRTRRAAGRTGGPHAGLRGEQT